MTGCDCQNNVVIANVFFPEINRAYTFGEAGSSGGQFYQQYLKDIKLNQIPIDWTSDVNRKQIDLLSQDVYDVWLDGKIRNATYSSSVQNLHNYITGLDENQIIHRQTKSPISAATIFTHSDTSIALAPDQQDPTSWINFPDYMMKFDVEFRLKYNSKDDLTSILDTAGLMTDIKADIRRAAYKDIVTYRFRGYRIWICPQQTSSSPTAIAV